MEVFIVRKILFRFRKLSFWLFFYSDRERILWLLYGCVDFLQHVGKGLELLNFFLVFCFQFQRFEFFSFLLQKGIDVIAWREEILLSAVVLRLCFVYEFPTFQKQFRRSKQIFIFWSILGRNQETWLLVFSLCGKVRGISGTIALFWFIPELIFHWDSVRTVVTEEEVVVFFIIIFYDAFVLAFFRKSVELLFLILHGLFHIIIVLLEHWFRKLLFDFISLAFIIYFFFFLCRQLKFSINKSPNLT